jgi:hypothetical protein
MRRAFLFLVTALAMWTTGALASAQDAQIAEAAIVRDAYWVALDRGDYVEAYALFTPGMQALSPADSFAREGAAQASQYGRTIERRVMRTTRYDNPANAPAPGIYIAFDFVGRFELVDRNCGYIILYQPPEGGPFQITRTDQTFMDNGAAEDASRTGQSAEQVWTQMASAYCPGWQPSWAIQPPV